ncbi:MAG: ABC transporter ATP-binding protein [Candidatus Cloacimonas sp.]|nr:ABC transporter ATP-binding protein [Candidatus Cloacimonas sp.]
MFLNSIRSIIAVLKLLKRRLLVQLLLCAILSSMPYLISFFLPLVSQKAINLVIYQNTLPISYMYIMISLYLLSIAFQAAGGLLTPKYSIQNDLYCRTQVMEKALSVNYRHFKENGSGYYTKIFTDDVSASLQVLQGNIIGNTFSLIRVLPIFYLIYTWDKPIFLVFTIAAVFIILYQFVITKIYQRHYGAVNEYAARIYSFVNETFSNILAIITFNYQALRLLSFSKHLDGYAKESKTLAVKQNVYGILFLELPLSLATLFIFCYSIYNVFHGRMELGRYFAIVSYFSMIRGPLESLQYLTEIIASSGVHAKRVVDFLQLADAENYQQTTKSNSITWEIENLHKNHDTTEILCGITFVVKKGEVASVVGISGEGKTSLMNVITGLDKQYNGKALFNGISLETFSFNDVIKQIEYCPQQCEIFNGSLKDNVVLGRESNDELYNRVIELVELGSISDRDLGYSGEFISGGEKARLSIGRFIYGLASKDFFILDEPLLSVDNRLKQRLLNVVKNEIQGKTGIVISHDLTIVNTLCNKIIIIEDGQVKAMGSHKDVITQSNLYRELITLQHDQSE